MGKGYSAESAIPEFGVQGADGRISTPSTSLEEREEGGERRNKKVTKGCQMVNIVKEGERTAIRNKT